MEAKDTIMSEKQITELWLSLLQHYPQLDILTAIREASKAQAEISFKAGMRVSIDTSQNCKIVGSRIWCCR